MIRLCGLSTGLAGALLLPAQAQDSYTLPTEPEENALSLTSTAWFRTDYVWRGVSQTAENPAVQAEFVLEYGLFFAGIWGSNVDYGGGPFGQNLASVEVDYFAGIAPQWRDIQFEVYGLYYTYPGACEASCGIPEWDYFELATAASYTFDEKLTLKVENFWTWENYNETGEADAVELSAEYSFSRKWWIFEPTVRSLIGWFWIEELDDYTYWNVGLDLAFRENWKASIDYWDTADLACADSGVEACDARIVGSIAAAF